MQFLTQFLRTSKYQKNYTSQLLEYFKKRKVYSSIKYKNWDVDLADMQLISKYRKGTWFLLGVIDIFGRNAWVVPLKNKNGIIITNAFQKFLGKSGCK